MLDDRISAGLATTMSNLFGRHGIRQSQFYEEFRVCNHCERIVSNEISRVTGHTCVIEL